MPRATQQSLGFAPAKTVKYGPKPPPTVKCGGCGQKIIRLALQGTSERSKDTGELAAGQRIACDPQLVPDGEFFLVGKILHRRRDTDVVGSFYKLHRCSGWA